MATTTTVSSNYAGRAAGEIIGQAFKEADTIAQGLVTVDPNVGHELNLRKISYTDGTTAYTCGFTPAGAIALTEKILKPVKLKNDIQLCKEDFRPTWSDESMGASAWNVNGPADILEAVQMEVLGQTAEDIDFKIWNGNATNTDEWDGFIKLFNADATVIKANNGIIPVAAPITETNIEAELKKVLAAIPQELRRKSLNVMVSANVYQAYSFFLISKGIIATGNADDRTMQFGRYTITEVQGLPDNTFVVAETKNLVLGTGLLEDFNTLAFQDEDEIGLMTGLVRGKMVYSCGVQYYNGNEVVWYLSTTAVTP